MAASLSRACNKGPLPAERPGTAKGTNGQNGRGGPWTGSCGGEGGCKRAPSSTVELNTALSLLLLGKECHRHGNRSHNAGTQWLKTIRNSPLCCYFGFSRLFSVVCFSVVVLFCVIKLLTSTSRRPPALSLSLIEGR